MSTSEALFLSPLEPDADGRLSVAFRGWRAIPLNLVDRAFRNHLRSLDVSHNLLTDLGELEEYPNLESLVCDNNRLKSTSKFPSLPKLHYFQANSNAIANLQVFAEAVRKAFPALRSLSVLNNAVCPNYFNGGSVTDYEEFRLQLLVLLPDLTRIDVMKVTPKERERARQLAAEIKLSAAAGVPAAKQGTEKGKKKKRDPTKPKAKTKGAGTTASGDAATTQTDPAKPGKKLRKKKGEGSVPTPSAGAPGEAESASAGNPAGGGAANPQESAPANALDTLLPLPVASAGAANRAPPPPPRAERDANDEDDFTSESDLSGGDNGNARPPASDDEDWDEDEDDDFTDDDDATATKGPPPPTVPQGSVSPSIPQPGVVVAGAPLALPPRVPHADDDDWD
eukprot:TRINITY_DN6542_c0_g2_i1.p1 TRINITY_DN6542_c0_g2~~TRINITY_DN6542_c0_g2_i1.p1  ORF type:complete len:454 (-),score=85.58 TRINITY_DN6542_c0_g2_i1:13-1200(-)